MPNRILKDSIRTSDTLQRLSWFEEVLFYRLIVSCDDYGRYDGRMEVIKGACFPLDKVEEEEIEQAIEKLLEVGLVMRYEVDDKPYIKLKTWEKYQTIRAKKSKYPDADNSRLKTSENICKQENTNVPVIQSNPIQSESESNPNRNTNTMCKAEASTLFERLWKTYPLKRGKGQVSDAKKRQLLDIGFDEMHRAINRYKADLERDTWRKPQNGSTFFNSGYVDYLDCNYGQGREIALETVPEEEDELVGDDW